MMESRERTNLSLRKHKIDQLIENKRLRHKPALTHLCPFEIIQEKLHIPDQWKYYKITNIDSVIQILKEFLKNENPDYIKLSVCLMRKYFLELDENNIDHKHKVHNALNLLIETEIIHDLQNLLLNSSDNSIIVIIIYLF